MGEMSTTGMLANPDRRRVFAVPVDGDSERQSVIRTFFRDARLVSIPVQHKKQLVILDVLAKRFEPGVRYLEVEVNFELAKVFADVAALRRGMVDNPFLDAPTANTGEPAAPLCPALRLPRAVPTPPARSTRHDMCTEYR